MVQIIAHTPGRVVGGRPSGNVTINYSKRVNPTRQHCLVRTVNSAEIPALRKRKTAKNPRIENIRKRAPDY